MKKDEKPDTLAVIDHFKLSDWHKSHGNVNLGFANVGVCKVVELATSLPCLVEENCSVSVSIIGQGRGEQVVNILEWVWCQGLM